MVEKDEYSVMNLGNFKTVTASAAILSKTWYVFENNGFNKSINIYFFYESICIFIVSSVFALELLCGSKTYIKCNFL